jgi:erythromycin esterase-like protein
MATRSDTLARQLEQSRVRIASELATTLRIAAEPLPSLDDIEEFGSMFDRFRDARLVLLGEATHGTAEFYRARAAITRRLIEEYGFSIVAVEADWPDAAFINAYVQHHETPPSNEEPFARFPQWMWRNAEIAEFVDWLRIHNRDRASDRRAAFRGLDIYSLRASMNAVLEYLNENDPELARLARQRYGCLTPWQEDPAHYGQAVRFGRQSTCEEHVVALLQDLLGRRLQHIRNDGEAFFDAAQNARIVRAAEQYYRMMYRSSTESWNLRDRHMFDTLQTLVADDRKAVVWAHNSHIGNAGATAMGWQGEFNVGELCRKTYGKQAVLIGFGTDRGTVAAADDWDQPMQIKAVLPARADSYEHAFREAGVSSSLTDWRVAPRAELTTVLSESLLERAIGVIYRPETELQSHYFECVLAEQFDAYVWFEETHAVSPLPTRHAHGMPETYPFGI